MFRKTPAHTDQDHRQSLRDTAKKLRNSLRNHTHTNFGGVRAEQSFRSHYKKLSRELKKWDELILKTNKRKLELAKKVRETLEGKGITPSYLINIDLPDWLALIATNRIKTGAADWPFSFDWEITENGNLEMGRGQAWIKLAALESAGISVESYKQAMEQTFQELQYWSEATAVAGDFYLLLEESSPIIDRLEVIQEAVSYPHTRKCQLC